MRRSSFFLFGIICSSALGCGVEDDAANRSATLGSMVKADRPAAEPGLTLVHAGDSGGWINVEAASDDELALRAHKRTSGLEFIDYTLGGAFALNRARLNDDHTGLMNVELWNVQYWNGTEFVAAFSPMPTPRKGWHVADFPDVITDRVRLQVTDDRHVALREFDLFGTNVCTSGADCDDGIACTEDVCQFDGCAHLDDACEPSACQFPGNLIQNCDFGYGLTGYASEIFFEGAFGTQSVVNEELEVVIDSGGSASWNVQPRQGGLALQANVPYSVSFRGRASEPRPLFVSITRDGDPFNSYSGEIAIDLTTEMQDFSFDFVMGPVGDDNVKFEVRAGFFGEGDPFSPMPTVVLDDLVLAAAGPACEVDADCDDGVACTADVCFGGECSHDESACPVASCQTPENLIQNCSFDQGLNGYASFVFFEGALGTQSAANAELEVTIENSGTANWNVQPRQEGLTLQANLAYEVRFRARASEPRSVVVSMTKNEPPWTSYSGIRVFDLTTEMQDYSFRFTMGPESDFNVKFEIDAGFNGEFPVASPMPTLFMDDLFLGPVFINPDRPSNSSCFAGDSPSAAVATEQYWAGVAFEEPLEVVQEPAAFGDAFLVVEKAGRVLLLENDASDAATRVFFHVNELSPPDQPLSTDGESGMTALAFHPNFGSPDAIGEHTIFIGYTRQKPPAPGESYAADLVLASFQTDETRTAVVLTSKVELLRLHQDSPIHNSGDIEFGPDGLLYMSVGDDGSNLAGDDNPAKANDPAQPNGKIFRLAPAQYDGTDTLEWSDVELVAMGLRNPWRMSFDGNELWIGNVGFDKIEEVNRLDISTDIGIHFGWPYCEGDVCCDEGIDCSALPPLPADSAFPQYSYRRSQGPSGESAVIGGFVYRGAAMPELYGKYVFGDFADQVVYALDPDSNQAEPILSNIGLVDDFGVDHEGEIYFTTLGGAVQRIVPGVAGPANWPPQDLLGWGCFDALGDGSPVPASGVLPYDIAQSFWSDGAQKQRYVAIPDGTFIDVTDPDDWQLPNGGVTIKNFYWEGQIFETRLFVRHNNGLYGGYTYQWNGPNEATLVPEEGASKDLGSIVWQYPSRAQCMTCHTAAAGRSLGLESRQLNIGSQLDALADLSLLSSSVPTALAPFPDILDSSVDLGARAESYLHVNCASCHRGAIQSEAGRAKWDARFATAFEDKGVCAAPIESVSGSPDERIVVAGDHELSTIWLRVHQRDNLFMPPLATVRVDTNGTELLEQWIDGLASCPSP